MILAIDRVAFMPGILDGIRVLDLTTVIMGPLATQTLGDLGADVIKIESPNGDISRQSLPRKSHGMGRTFLSVNRNKRSVCLDLKQPEGRAALLALARTADVLVYNIRPQAMARMKLDYDDLAGVNAKIIYVGAFGFSQKGPYAARPAYDDVIQGMIALPWLAGIASGEEPRYVPMSFADRSVANNIVIAVLGALFHRERTGKGQRIDVPMFETLATMVLNEHLEGEAFVPPLGPMGHARSISLERRPYQTKDGYICTLIYNDQHWKSFLKIVGQPELFTSDERFSSYSNRTKHVEHVSRFLADKLKERTTADWLAAFDSNDIAAGPMYSLDDVLADKHLADTGYFKQVEHPTEGTLRTLPYPTEWSQADSSYRHHAPHLGEHTRSLLREAGYAENTIEDLLARGVARDASVQASR
jgi:crotonobetainyl-CoA:carnitine CoA-transferase CaiB-like acyl-CoA transferase